MIWSFIVNIPFAFGILVTYLFCLGDIVTSLGTTTGFPFIYVFSQATTVGGAIGMTFVIWFLLFDVLISTYGGMPYTNWLSHYCRILV